MQDAGNWALSNTEVQGVKTPANRDDPVRQFNPGWWILPSAALGSLSWAGIFYLIFW